MIVAAYLLAYAMLLITGARLGDLHGFRRIFLGGVALFTLASAACALAPSAAILILARVVQGGGAALMVPQVLTGIHRSFEGRARARALAPQGGALPAGHAFAVVTGGFALLALLAAGAARRSTRRAAQGAPLPPPGLS